MKSSEKPNGSFAGILLGTLFIVGAVGLFEFGNSIYTDSAGPQKAGTHRGQSIKARSANDIELSISQHVQETSKELEDKAFKKKIQANLNLQSPALPNQKTFHQAQPIPLDTPASAETEELQNAAANGLVSPRDIIEGELADRQLEERRIEKERKEYLRKYVENARAKGWKVDLNEDGTVRRVSPIPQRQALPIEEPAP